MKYVFVFIMMPFILAGIIWEVVSHGFKIGLVVGDQSISVIFRGDDEN